MWIYCKRQQIQQILLCRKIGSRFVFVFKWCIYVWSCPIDDVGFFCLEIVCINKLWLNHNLIRHICLISFSEFDRFNFNDKANMCEFLPHCFSYYFVLLLSCYIFFCYKLVRNVNPKVCNFLNDGSGLSQILFFWRCKLSESYNFNAFDNPIAPRKLKNPISPRKPCNFVSLTISRTIQRISWKNRQKESFNVLLSARISRSMRCFADSFQEMLHRRYHNNCVWLFIAYLNEARYFGKIRHSPFYVEPWLYD